LVAHGEQRNIIARRIIPTSWTMTFAQLGFAGPVTIDTPVLKAGVTRGVSALNQAISIDIPRVCVVKQFMVFPNAKLSAPRTIITRQAIRQGSFGNVTDHIAVIRCFNDGYNDRCQSLIWPADVDAIIAKAKRSLKTKAGTVM
jgi:hypothetical protein